MRQISGAEEVWKNKSGTDNNIEGAGMLIKGGKGNTASRKRGRVISSDIKVCMEVCKYANINIAAVKIITI